jgi:peptidoglycan lytic transglycosylase D
LKQQKKRYHALPASFHRFIWPLLLPAALFLSPVARSDSADDSVQLKLDSPNQIGQAAQVSQPEASQPPVSPSEANPAPVGAAQQYGTPKVADSNVWDRVREGLRMDPMNSPLVGLHARWYADHPAYVARMLERSRRYLYHIVGEVEQRGMPMEIALLPMIESGYNPQALSHSHAAGIWQFVPETGKHYGLMQNAWYDGRRDITAATQAALDYLQQLFMDFGSWELALAAYNCGEGCVSKAQQRNAARGLPTDYASLNLPIETKHYVPKLLAIKELIQEPQNFGVELNDIPNAPYFTQVSLSQNNMDIRSAARLAGMNVDEFLSLNPAFPRSVIRSNAEVTVLVPVDKADEFQTNLEKGKWDSWQPVRAHKGETPAQLARRYGTTVARLSEHSHLRVHRGRLAANQIVLVPVRTDSEATNDKETATWAEAGKRGAPEDAQSTPPSSRIHVVRRGETLVAIARKYRVSIRALKRWNNLASAHVKAGQRLTIAQGSVVAPRTPSERSGQRLAHGERQPGGKARYYTVRRGDTLSSISGRFNIAMADLRRWNQIRGHRIEAGTKLVIRS